MSKRELDGYMPLRPWERLVCYTGLVALVVAGKILIVPGAPVIRTAGLTIAGIIAFTCAFLAYWDARVTARLKKKARRRNRCRMAAVAPRVVAPAFITYTFAQRGGAEWQYFDDTAPTTS